MGKPDKGAPFTERSRPEDSPAAASPHTSDMVDILDSVDKKLSSFDAPLSILEILHKEFQILRESVEFSQQQFSIWKSREKSRSGDSRAVILMDKLNVNGQRYRDQKTTLWLY